MSEFDPRKALEAAHKAYLLGWIQQALVQGGRVFGDIEMVQDIDGNPGHLEVHVPQGDVTLQIIIKPIPKEPGVPARTSSM